MRRPGIVNQLYFSMAQKLLPTKPKAAPDHLSALQVRYLGDGNVGGGNVGGRGNGVALGGGCGSGVAVGGGCARASLAGHDDGVGDDDDNGDEGSEKDLTSQSNTKVSPSQRFKPGVQEILNFELDP